MAEVEWTPDTTIRLMEEYKQKPELWDTSHDLYRVQTAKYEAWSELARIFQCDIADLRKKLNSIFASHRREKAKIRAGGHSSWFLYNYLCFLPNHVENTASVETTAKISHQKQDTDYSESSDDNDNREEHEVVIKQEPHVFVKEQRTTKRQAYERPKYHRTTRPLLKRRIIKDNQESSNQLDNRLLETLRLLRKSDLSKKKDECDSFGEYIAVSLRKHDDRTQSMIKQAINNILFEQEMKKYSIGQYTVVISGDNDNPLGLGSDSKE